MDNMGLYNFIGVLSVILGIVKELVIILAIIKGIQIGSVYLKKNKNEKVDDKDREENTENKEDK